MMEIKENFIKQMLECNWLGRCGHEDDIGFDVEYIKSQNKVKKLINSIKWENVCLEARGDFTAFLHTNYKDEYNKYWNEMVRKVKSEHINLLLKNIERNTDKCIGGEDILMNISMNLVSLFMVNCYSDYYSSDFYDRMLKIYLSGHLPCGWNGTYPDGKFVVF